VNVGLPGRADHAARTHIVVVLVAGVAGSGKTTIGGLLAGRLGWSFTDGDSLHPAANIAKMAAGHPLTDEDRRPWLAAIEAWMDQRIGAGDPAVMACSALKRRYRDQLLGGRPNAAMAFLLIDREVVATRLAARRGHFIDPRLVDSQFADLEPPAPDEPSVVALLETGSPEETAGQIAGRLGLVGRAKDQ